MYCRKAIFRVFRSMGVEDVLPALEESYNVVNDLKRKVLQSEGIMSLETALALTFLGQQTTYYVARNDILRLRAPKEQFNFLD